MSSQHDVHRCTLTPGEAAGRLDADRALAERVVATERLDRAVRVVFAGGTDSRRLVDTFVANERRCCGFFEFTVTESDAAIAMEIAAPAAESAQQLVDAAKRAFDLGPDAAAPGVTRRSSHG